MVRAALISIAAALVVSAAAGPAYAARFARCPGDDLIDFRCTRVSVPLDRSGAVRGRVSLLVTRLRAPRREGRRRRAPLITLAGGPGQAAVPLAPDFAEILFPERSGRDLVVFDQRGTGRSGLLRCRELERANLLRAGRAAGRCAQRLGVRRAHYSTRDSVEDIEALRRRLRAPKVALFGVSYGTKVALAYAAAHPDRVDRLLLDSVVEIEGPDPLYRETFAAMPRVLRSICVRRACRGITRDPARDLTRLAAGLGRAPLLGGVVGRDGRDRAAKLTRGKLFALLLAADLDPALRSELPAALRSAVSGDPAPILRVARRAGAVESAVGSPRLFSTALYAATSCEESPLPWARETPFAERRRQAAQLVARLPPDAFQPFDRATAVASDTLRLCERWPAAAEHPTLATAVPAVPTLLLAGEADLRTPLESARRLSARLPGSRLLVVPGAGHSVVGNELTCIDRAVARFLAGRLSSGRCRRARPELPVAPVAPASLAGVRAAPGVRGRRGRTVAAVALTLLDAITTLSSELDPLDPFAEVTVGGGLRGGRVRATDSGLRLSRVVYVPGVRVSGTLDGERLTGVLRVSGGAASAGTLRFRRDGTIAGRLGGRRVRTQARGGRGEPSVDVVLSRSARARRIGR